jgi:glycosyltransferase involved in cell wall biosynthesis
MKILAFPRDPNPYQELLYGEMEKLGARVAYIAQLTPSHTLNLLLLPLEILCRRLSGAQLVHLHWMFGFELPGGRKYRIVRRLSQIWFIICVYCIRLSGMKLAWTAHNVLPHAPVFADDVSARGFLARHCDVVIGHTDWTFEGLAKIGARPKRGVVVPHGPFGPAASSWAGVASTSRSDDGRKLLFFGKVVEYKGVEDLLAAIADIPESQRVHLTVAGECNDAALRNRVEGLARHLGDRVSLRLEYIPESDVGSLMAAADVVVLPFRQVTSSGSAILALGFGKPILIPGLPALAGIPAGSAFRYDGSTADLRRALIGILAVDGSRLAEMSAAALSYRSAASWEQIAADTVAIFQRIMEKSVHGSLLDSALSEW